MKSKFLSWVVGILLAAGYLRLFFLFPVEMGWLTVLVLLFLAWFTLDSI